MRHRKHRQTLGVKKEHRSALLANLASSLIKKGRVRTTLTKAKALRPFVERIVTLAKKEAAKTAAEAAKGDAAKKRYVHHRRLAISRLRDKEAVAKLFNERVGDFSARTGGYTRIYKLADQRIGDAAEMAIIEFVGAGDTGYKKGRSRAKAKPTAAAAPAVEAAAPAEPVAETAPATTESAPPAEIEKKE
jgi:large subunit ribosomal protein L17